MSKARDSIEDLKTIDANLAAKAPIASPSFTGNVGIGAGTALSPLDVKSGFITVSKDANTAGRVGASEYITGSTANDLIVQATGSGVTKLYQSGVNSLNIDAAGIVTKPLQPAFSACLGTSHTFAVGTTTIVFNSEIFDQNSDFNASAATFTAPVTGKYQFNISVRVDNLDQGAGYYRLRLKTSNGDYQPVILGTMDVFNADPTYYYFSMPVLADMDAGDTAYVQLQVSGGAAQAQIHASRPNANFSGYLVA